MEIKENTVRLYVKDPNMEVTIAFLKDFKELCRKHGYHDFSPKVGEGKTKWLEATKKEEVS